MHTSQLSFNYGANLFLSAIPCIFLFIRINKYNFLNVFRHSIDSLWMRHLHPNLTHLPIPPYPPSALAAHTKQKVKPIKWIKTSFYDSGGVSWCVTKYTLLPKQLYLKMFIGQDWGLWFLLQWQYRILSGTPLRTLQSLSVCLCSFTYTPGMTPQWASMHITVFSVVTHTVLHLVSLYWPGLVWCYCCLELHFTSQGAKPLWMADCHLYAQCSWRLENQHTPEIHKHWSHLQPCF